MSGNPETWSRWRWVMACLEVPEAAPAPVSLRRADGRSVYQRHGGVKYATRMQLSREEQLVAQAGARGAPSMTREEAAYGLGAEPAELEAALHQPPAAEIETAACGLRMDQAAAAFHVLTSDRRDRKSTRLNSSHLGIS